MTPKLLKSSKYIVLALLIYMPVFGFLDTMPVRIWDESRIAINAYEMYYDHDFIVTHCNYEAEMWNTKPPFLIWCQVFFMKLIGINEIALRLPSAFAAFFTCLVLLIFSARYLKSAWLGIIAVLVLITTQGYINDHISRTGEYDALLTLFTTAGCLLFFAFCETKQTRYLYWFFAALTLGVLTKSVAGLLFTPALFLYCLIQKQLMSFFKNKHFYIGLLCFIVVIAGYYLLRESRNPGYIAVVQENEWGGRYLKSQGDQTFTFWFYYNNFVKDRFADRYFLVPLGLLVGLLSRNPRLKKFTLFASLMSFTFFLIISAGKTRLEQYDAPLYPFLVFFVAVFVHFIFEQIQRIRLFNITLRTKLFPCLFLVLLFMIPYQKIWAKTYMPKEKVYWDAEFYEIGYFLKDALRGKHDMNGKFLLYDGYNAQNIFYLRLLWDSGICAGFKYPHEIKAGDKIITCQASMRQLVERSYLYEKIFTKGTIVIYKITGISPAPAEASG